MMKRDILRKALCLFLVLHLTAYTKSKDIFHLIFTVNADGDRNEYVQIEGHMACYCTVDKTIDKIIDVYYRIYMDLRPYCPVIESGLESFGKCVIESHECSFMFSKCHIKGEYSRCFNIHPEIKLTEDSYTGDKEYLIPIPAGIPELNTTQDFNHTTTSRACIPLADDRRVQRIRDEEDELVEVQHSFRPRKYHFIHFQGPKDDDILQADDERMHRIEDEEDILGQIKESFEPRKSYSTRFHGPKDFHFPRGDWHRNRIDEGKYGFVDDRYMNRREDRNFELGEMQQSDDPEISEGNEDEETEFDDETESDEEPRSRYENERLLQREKRYSGTRALCPIPNNLKTADLICTIYPSKTRCLQRCQFGYTVADGIRVIRECRHDENLWRPYEIMECQPFVNCNIRLMSSGDVSCHLGTLKKPPSCTIECLLYENNDPTPPAKYDCNIYGRWHPELPFCVTNNTGLGLVSIPEGPLVHVNLTESRKV